MEPNTSFSSSSDDLRVETGTNGLDPTVDRPLLTPDLARGLRDGAERGFRFKLRRTGLLLGEDVYARVKPLDLTDRAIVGSLPTAMQSRIMRALMAVGKAIPAMNEKTNTLSIPVALKNLEKNEELVNAYCVVGFLDPPLIWTEAERTASNQVVVTDIALIDRREFFAVCGATAEDEANRLEFFPVRPLPAVATRPDGDAVRAAPVPVAEPAPAAE